MIQRIQTIWLAISAISAGLLLKGSIVSFISATGEKLFINISGINRIKDSGNELVSGSHLLTVLVGLTLIFSIITLFMYKIRKTQKKYSLLVIGLSICIIALLMYHAFGIISTYDAEVITGLKMFLPLIILLAAILAYRGILKDDRLVKSFDRLR